MLEKELSREEYLCSKILWCMLREQWIFIYNYSPISWTYFLTVSGIDWKYYRSEQWDILLFSNMLELLERAEKKVFTKKIKSIEWIDIEYIFNAFDDSHYRSVLYGIEPPINPYSKWYKDISKYEVLKYVKNIKPKSFYFVD